MLQIFFKKLLLFTVVVVLGGCNKDFQLVYQPVYQNDFEFYKKVADNDTILLISQGGPSPELVSKEKASNLLDFFPYNIAMVHQSQTKDPSVLDQFYISKEQANQLNDLSEEILNRTIDLFKEDGKHVVVFGVSFGSFLGLRAIAAAGVKADLYALMNGRLDMEEEFWKLFKDKYYGYFEFREEKPQRIEKTKYISEKRMWATTALMGNVGEPRYSRLLSETKLSKLIYLHRFQDRVVGPMQPSEINFLQKQGAKVIGNDGDHGFNEKEYKFILDFIRSN